MDGVLKAVEVAPNSRVAAGDLLARYDEAPLRARRDLAARALDVARADLRRAQQGAFGDRQSAGQVALLEAQMRVRETDLAAAEEFLARAELRAEREGLAVFADREEWTGRPVRTGERILRLADPAKVELRIDVAPADAAILAPGARVVFFLDADPLRPLAGRLVRASYETARTAEGTLAHRAVAEFDEGTFPPRIGLKGTAKIEGEDVALALYLFRRPLASFRQLVGQ
jgi:multidrug efflux pump subunit AcrA (membrane-fusion protein)